ncbi:MAG: hypothetical protein HND52_12685 [Ignavibacteriae bacterium]|nr:hypothetical protein [Ignavibacteriota bacterium]NOG98807.1 hypothetical protein [Ignavibacteriota bacterium]
MKEFIVANELDENNYVYLPSGEEISLFSVGNNYETLKLFKYYLDQSVNDEIIKNNIVGFNKFTISFGSFTFKKEEIIEKIDNFLSNIKNDSSNKAAKEYYEFLYLLRKPVEKNIDIEKFKSLVGNKDNGVVALRNFIYFKMIKYKNNLTNTLPIFNSIINSYDPHQVKELTNTFGIDNKKAKIIDKIIKENKGFK